jgi:cytochrome P450
MNLLSQSSLADAEIQERPDAYHHALHEQPVFFDDALGFYICSKYRLMREILRDTETFSSVGSQTIDALRPPPPEVRELRKQMWRGVDTLVTNDPPQHTRTRTLLDEPFRRRNIEWLIPSIREIINAAIDDFIIDGRCEFVSRFAIPVPIRVILDMLGLPRDLATQTKAWSDAAVEPLGMMVSDERLIECAKLTLEFQRYFAAELEARQHEPRDDLLSHIAVARDEHGQGFSMEEMLSICAQLLVAGNETTTNGLAAGMRRLIDHPEQRHALENRPAGDLNGPRTLANETLRLDAPVQGLFRIVTQDVELAGVQLRTGDRIMLRFAAANRDPDKYDDPDALDVCRHNAGTHVGFGAGIHHCIGANLAREEMTQAFDILLSRLTDLAFVPDANDFRHHPSMILRGLKALHISFSEKG